MNGHSHFTEQDVQNLFSCQKYPSPWFSRLRHGLSVDPPPRTPLNGGSKRLTHMSLCTLFCDIFPFWSYVQGYTWETFVHDFSGGLAVGVASIPMGMSYALLAGLHPVYGLYTDFIYPLLYMVLGSQPQICVGTSAIEAIMTAQSINKLVPTHATPEARIDVAVQLAFCVGIVLIFMRLLKFGVVSRFLAYPILSGFSTGSAIVIATAQLQHITGIPVPHDLTSAVDIWWYLLTHGNRIRIPCVVTTCFGLAMLILTKKMNQLWFKRCPVPPAFFLMASTIPLSYVLYSSAWFTIDLVGTIPQGFPSFSIPSWNPNNIYALIKQAFIYSIFYLFIHITIAKTVAQQHGILMDGNQETLACGVSSVIGSFFQCYPIATSLSRTCIATSTGAATPFYNIFNSAVVGLTLVLGTPLLYYLPKASLSALVLTGVYGMLFLRDGVSLLHMSIPDFLLWFVCCIVIILRGATEGRSLPNVWLLRVTRSVTLYRALMYPYCLGVTVAVIMSVAWLLKKNAFPDIVELGRLPNTFIYRDVQRFPMALLTPRCHILRFDASLHFANTERLEHYIYTVCGYNKSRDHHVVSHTETKVHESPLDTMIIDASSINDMDVSAVRMLKMVSSQLEKDGILLLFANWKGPMRDFLERSEFYTFVKPDHCFLSLHDAVLWSQSLSPKPPLNTGIELQEVSSPRDSDVFDTEEVQSSVHCTTPLHTPQIRFVTESSGIVKRQWPVVIPPTIHHLST